MTINPLFEKSYFTASSKIIKIFVVCLTYFKRLTSVCQILIFRKRYELLLIEYELFPYFPALFEYLLNKRGIRYIVDYDDAIFHKYDRHKNKLVRYLLKNKIAKVIKYAKHVIVCNDYLESYARKYNPDILKLPTVVLSERYQEAMEGFEKVADKPFVIGWIGSKSTSLYILDILPAIKKFIEKYDDVRFDLVRHHRFTIYLFAPHSYGQRRSATRFIHVSQRYDRQKHSASAGGRLYLPPPVYVGALCRNQRTNRKLR